MTNKTISDLTAGTAPDGTEVVETVQGGVSVKLTLADILTRADGENHLTLSISAGDNTGDPLDEGQGGGLSVQAGNGWDGGQIDFFGGGATTAGSDGGGGISFTGGPTQIEGANGVAVAMAGAVTVNGGGFTVTGGRSAVASGDGGSITLTGGTARSDAGNGGDVVLVAGSNGSDARFGYVSLQARAIKALAVTVAQLPAAADADVGARGFVTDALTTLTLGIGTVVADGGANKVPVYSDGTNWLYG